MHTFFYTITGRGPVAAREFIAQLTPDSQKAFIAVSRHGGAPLPCGGATVAEAALLLGRTCRQILGESVTLKPEVPPCRWFALCTNAATGTTDAGPLGKVPACERCAKKAERLGAPAQEVI